MPFLCDSRKAIRCFWKEGPWGLSRLNGLRRVGSSGLAEGFFYLGGLCVFAGVFVKNVPFSVVSDGGLVVECGVLTGAFCSP
jgi:hypothetical protein